jgi:hypothetical protein
VNNPVPQLFTQWVPVSLKFDLPKRAMSNHRTAIKNGFLLSLFKNLSLQRSPCTPNIFVLHFKRLDIDQSGQTLSTHRMNFIVRVLTEYARWTNFGGWMLASDARSGGSEAGNDFGERVASAGPFAAQLRMVSTPVP